MNRHTLDLLERYECRNVLYRDRSAGWPIVWERAKGIHVQDANGQRYVDLTAAFGVAAAGHANPRVVRAGQRQMERLLHAMGDVHPHPLKASLARELSRLTFERWTRARSSGKTLFCNSGFEAVEAALKTSVLATGKPGIIAFTGAYHGLGYGTLNATHRVDFHGPFQVQLRRFGHFLPFPDAALPAPADDELERLAESILSLCRDQEIGAVLVEPIQARGGIRVPPPGFLPMLRRVCDRTGALLILDEIYTGFGRTGRWFACEHSKTVPDVICLGKALTGGFPLSACVGQADLMDRAWPKSRGEALHTSTFLGHPVGCAMALAHLEEIRRLDLVRRSARLGQLLREALETLAPPQPTIGLVVRGLGLMAGLELVPRRPKALPEGAVPVVQAMLRRGYILLPEGEHATVISFTPPLTISQAELTRAVKVLEEVLLGGKPPTPRRRKRAVI